MVKELSLSFQFIANAAIGLNEARNLADGTPDSNRNVIITGDTCPPVLEVPDDIATRFEIDTTFYKKYVEAVGGIPIVSSERVSDAALLQVKFWCIDLVMSHYWL